MNANTATGTRRTAVRSVACSNRPRYFTRREIEAWLNTPESLAALAEAKDMEAHPEAHGRGARTRLELLRMLHS